MGAGLALATNRCSAATRVRRPTWKLTVAASPKLLSASTAAFIYRISAAGQRRALVASVDGGSEGSLSDGGAAEDLYPERVRCSSIQVVSTQVLKPNNPTHTAIGGVAPQRRGDWLVGGACCYANGLTWSADGAQISWISAPDLEQKPANWSYGPGAAAALAEPRHEAICPALPLFFTSSPRAFLIAFL